MTKIYKISLLFLSLFFITIFNLKNSESIESFVIEPYLQNITSKSVNVLWQTASSDNFVVKVREFKGETSRTYKVDTSSGSHNLQLRKLSPNTLYTYEFFDTSKKKIFSSRFKTPNTPRNSKRTKISILGDSGVNSIEQHKIAKLIQNSNPDFIIHTGDIVYPSGEIEDYTAKYFHPYKDIIKKFVIFPAVGNHDAINIKGYDTAFYTPFLKSKSSSNRYYSFNNGLTHVTIIDTSTDFKEGSVQYKWIESDLLRASTARDLKKLTRIVALHHPPYSSGTHGENSAVKEGLTPLFSKYDVKLVLTGHEHNYERIKRAPDLSSDLSGQETGPLYIVTGGGGVALRKQRDVNYSKSEKFLAQHHYVKLQVLRKRLIGTVINLDNQIIDQWIIQ